MCVAGGVTGAHINPAVTLAFAVSGDFPWKKVIPYWIAQMVGAFVGAAVVFWDYGTAIGAYEKAAGIVRGTREGPPDSTASYSIVATFPAGYHNGNLIGPFADQVLGTFFLLLFIYAIADRLPGARGPRSQAGDGTGRRSPVQCVAVSACRRAAEPPSALVRDDPPEQALGAPGSRAQ